VTLDVAGREIVTPMAPLLETWTGEYLTLWNPPAVWKREMQIGMRGNDIIWLRRRIGEVLGRPVGGAEADLYDEPLKAAVAAFQRSHGLKDDGIAGVRTVIQLEPAERAATVPLLRTAER
jgi:general secretion pathway protein A